MRLTNDIYRYYKKKILASAVSIPSRLPLDIFPRKINSVLRAFLSFNILNTVVMKKSNILYWKVHFCFFDAWSSLKFTIIFSLNQVFEVKAAL